MADRYSFGHKALSVVLSVVLLGFGWPAVNPSETFASDESAQADQVQAEVAQPEETQALEETADDSAAMALATADEAAPVAASDKQAVAEPAADESATASAPSASDEEEASAVEDAVEEDSAVGNQGSSQAAAAQAKTEYDISLVLKNASIKKADGTDELVSSPATKVAVSADKDFKFTVVPDSAYKLNCVLVNVAGQESPLTSDSDDVYVVASSDIAKGATLTVEASSALGNVGTVLGGVFGGGAASDVSGNAGETTSAKVGDKVTLKGTSNKNCSYAGDWTVKKNGESTSAGTVKGNGGSATAVFSEAGTFEIEHTYCEASHFLGFGDHSVKTEAFTVVVQPATPAQAISISGSDTVTQFSSIQLTATVVPAEATGAYVWSSSNEDILTVDNSGNVTGVRQGTATVTVSFRSAADGSVVSASKDVTVAATEKATDRASVYYLVDPTKDANSNDSGNWGAASLGIAMVNTTGATWTGGKNCFDNVDQRVVSWPNGTNVVLRDSDAWNEIFNNYKTTIQAQLPGVTFTKDDVEEIALVPAKISKNNGTNPDMHLDCNVSIKCKNVALVKYHLRDAGSTQFEQKGAKNYISGNATQPSDVMNEQFPETKTVDGVTYTFSGWYLDQSFTQPATFPYTVNSSTNFYAKYVGGFQVTYDLAGGSWNNSDATTYIAQEGSTQTVKSEPTREGYKFTGWTIEGLPDTTALKSGDTFAMPAGNVTITANWQELLSYRVKYLEKGTEKQLADPDTRYGEQGEKVSADAKTIDGYHLADGCSSHIEKTFGSSDNDITFWYEKDSVEYTVNYYLNGTEQKVADSETKSAPWGTQVKASDLAKDIDGYTAVPNQDKPITVNRDGKSSINVYYYQNVDLVANSDTKTYNGSEQSVSGFTGAPEGADFSNITVGAHGTDAGTYDAQFANGTVGTVDKTEKYIVVSAKDGKLVIGKAKVTLKSADLSKKYDGTALKNGDNALETESGFAEGEGATYEFTGSQTVVGSSPNAFNYTLNEGTKADNYTITKSEGTLTVTNRDAKYEIEVESNSAEFTYDGNEHMAEGFKTLEFTVDGNEYTVSGLSASVAKTDAGTYSNAITGTAKVVDASDNDVSDQFSVTTKSGSLVIKQASAHMKSASGEWVYDGNEHAKHEMESVTGFAKGEGATYSYTGAITNAGTVQNTFTYTLNEGTKASNYTFDDPEYGILKVTPVSDEVTVTIKGNTATETYDGTEKAVRDYGFEASNGLYGAGDFVFTGAAVAKGTNVGTYKMGLDKGQFSNTSANFSNVTFVVEDGWLKIEGGQIDANAVTWTKQDVQKVYDGKPLSAFAARATDKHGNELNIEYSIDGETWTFDPAEISLTHFGSQKVLLRAAGSNYTAGQYATSSENIAIKKRPVTLTSASANKVYDGKPLTNDTVTSTPLGVGVGFLDGEGVTCNVTGSQTNVGESDNEFTYTFNEGTSKSDYLVTYEFGKLIVTQDNTEVVVTITEHSGAFEYDGTEKTVSGYDFSASNELYKNTDFEFTGNDSVSATNVGTYDMELKSENFKNTNGNFSKVTFVVVDGQLTITPKSVDPEAGKGMSVGKLPHVTYNGESQKQKPEVKDGNTLLTEGTDYTLVYSKDTTNVGTVTVAVEGKGNYAGEAEVTYEILKRQVTLESSSASKVYDGTPLTKHEAGVTGGSMVDGESFVYEFTGTQTVAGESANSFIISAGDGTNLDNYEITKQDGTLKVEPKGIVPGEDNGMKVTKPVDKVYNGKEQKFVPVVTDGEKVLVENVDYVVTYTDALGFEDDAAAKDDFTNVTGDIFVTVTGIGNYAGSLTQSYQITPKPYTVTTVSGSKVYDGTPLEGASLEGNFVGGLVNDDDATFVVTGTQTEVGASDNTYTLEFVDERMAKNYKLVKEDIGTLTVVKDESEASQNSNGNGESKNKGALPKTGDMTLATLPFVLAVVAGAVLCAAPVARRRSKF